MKIIIHDLKKVNIKNDESEKQIIFSANEIKQYCRGCFNCWVRTPGQCILKDGYEKLGKELGNAEEVVIISRCVYGSVSPKVKQVIDRTIGYAHPFFVFHKGEMHHKRRYATHFNLHVIFYGEMTQEEKVTAKLFADLLKKKYTANMVSLHFYRNEEDVVF